MKLYVFALFILVVSASKVKEELMSSLQNVYRNQALKYHPDKGIFPKNISNILFNELTNVFDTLKQFVDDFDDDQHSDCDNREDENDYYREYTEVIDEHNNVVVLYNALVSDFKHNLLVGRELLEKYNSLVERNTEVINKHNNLVGRHTEVINQHNYCENQLSNLSQMYNYLLYRLNARY
jgi:hypothetical protein